MVLFHVYLVLMYSVKHVLKPFLQGNYRVNMFVTFAPKLVTFDNIELILDSIR